MCNFGQYTIVLGDGPTVKGSGVFHDVPVHIQGITVVEDFPPLSL